MKPERSEKNKNAELVEIAFDLLACTATEKSINDIATNPLIKNFDSLVYRIHKRLSEAELSSLRFARQEVVSSLK